MSKIGRHLHRNVEKEMIFSQYEDSTDDVFEPNEDLRFEASLFNTVIGQHILPQSPPYTPANVKKPEKAKNLNIDRTNERRKFLFFSIQIKFYWSYFRNS